MGLDMYLTGEKYFKGFDGPERRMEDGFEVERHILALGEWRKHPNLHGYIVELFANGVDDCEQIYLNAENLLQIIAAVKCENLPHTEGFFFGVSDLSEIQKREDEAILYAAHDWLKRDIEGVWKTIYYRACW